MATYSDQPYKVGFICLFLVVVCGGIAVHLGIGTIYQPLRLAAQAEPVEGTVLSTTIKEWEGQVNEYEAVVKYRYSYDGNTFTNDNLSSDPIDSYESLGPVRDVLNEHDSGDRVTVHVHSEEPSTSFLINEPLDTWTLLFALVNLVLALAGIMGLTNVVRTLWK